MNCPNCKTENPARAKFCFNCGTPFAGRCSNCGTDLPAGARFCMSCGQPVNTKVTTDDARLSRLAAAAPAPLVAKMRAAHLAGERKMVTCLFADVVGSTSLAEKMDAEDWTAIMNRAFDLISPSIYRYEGTIARLLGDALLAFFGAPVAHEDDPARAVRASLDLLAAVREYAAEVRQKNGIEFAMRIGLNTGPVVVGEVGSDLKYEYTAMGDAINLAARMQSAAKPMMTLIAENTFRFVSPLFDCNDLGQIEVKGKAGLVRVYEVKALKAEPGRVRGLAGLESPMVGREAELESLLQLSTAVNAGLGRVAVIIGEPGLGKSRLISEWKAASQLPNPNVQNPTSSLIRSRNRSNDFSRSAKTATEVATTNPFRDLLSLQWVEGHCVSYGQGLAYHLLLDLLRSLIGVQAAAGEPETRDALLNLMSRLGEDFALEVYPYLGHLLSLQLEGAALERVKALDPQALQGQYLSALRRLLQTLAARNPLALILDDIHWADPSSTELLIKLLPLTSSSPLLFCFVTRPDRDAPGWKIVAAARESQGVGLTEFLLNPLSEADSRQLVSNLLEIESLPEAIRDIILKKAEGNPFFVEEVIRMLIDRGAILKNGESWAAGREIQTVEIPDNLQGLLLARIDRLPEDVKRALRVASVIGRQFSVRVLEQVLNK